MHKTVQYVAMHRMLWMITPCATYAPCEESTCTPHLQPSPMQQQNEYTPLPWPASPPPQTTHHTPTPNPARPPPTRPAQPASPPRAGRAAKPRPSIISSGTQHAQKEGIYTLTRLHKCHRERVKSSSMQSAQERSIGRVSGSTDWKVWLFRIDVARNAQRH